MEKLTKYLESYIDNDPICAAFALDPAVREEGLRALLVGEMKSERRFNEIMAWIKDRTLKHTSQGDNDSDKDAVEWAPQPERVNKFASQRFRPGNKAPTQDLQDPWACYISDVVRFHTGEDEPVLAYWKRMSNEKELRPLALLAKYVIGLTCSSASVERPFSHCEHVLGKRRGSMSARRLAKQLSLRMWELQKFMAQDDL